MQSTGAVAANSTYTLTCYGHRWFGESIGDGDRCSGAASDRYVECLACECCVRRVVDADLVEHECDVLYRQWFVVG